MNRRSFLAQSLAATATASLSRAASGEKLAIGLDHFSVRATGWKAAQVRTTLANAESEEKFGESLKNLMPVIGNDDLEVVGFEPVTADGAFAITYRGKAKMDWSPYEGEKETRFELSSNVIRWDPDFEREDDKGADLPFEVNEKPYWERMEEIVLLPNDGKGFKVEAADIDREVAGVKLKRSVRQDAGRVTSTSEFRTTIREVAAKDVKATKDALEKLKDEDAWIVGPREKKKKEKKAAA